MKHYLIYKITNKLNGRFYIGQHQTENIDDGYMGSGIAICDAIKKYGIENFTKEIIFDVDNWELMDFIEELIVDEEFVKREDTYNIALGGTGGYGLGKSNQGKKGHPCSEETKRKIIAFHKGRHRSEEAKQHMSDSHKGKQSPIKGKKRSKEFCKKISEAGKGRIPWNKGKRIGQQSEETKRKRSEAVRRWWAERKVS